MLITEKSQNTYKHKEGKETCKFHPPRENHWVLPDLFYAYTNIYIFITIWDHSVHSTTLKPVSFPHNVQ